MVEHIIKQISETYELYKSRNFFGDILPYKTIDILNRSFLP